ncbi:PREDICTED: uncharacterized protein LOC104714729 [Camelina sativa]|uniref:Uncharacterized protein LOC104714729 n=1 Tax=Camelina sativa TaxID=90675 RepID=A0ABM0TS99_CAMSA|nr:PREDICTED: uncharacterized protein LOC104714729 [Camelina sativa]
MQIGFVVDYDESDQDSLNQQGTVAPSGLPSQQQNRLSAMDLGAVISTQELGGSSTSGSNEASSSSNIPIICISCRETGVTADDIIRRRPRAIIQDGPLVRLRHLRDWELRHAKSPPLPSRWGEYVAQPMGRVQWRSQVSIAKLK